VVYCWWMRLAFVRTVM